MEWWSNDERTISLLFFCFIRRLSLAIRGTTTIAIVILDEQLYIWPVLALVTLRVVSEDPQHHWAGLIGQLHVFINNIESDCSILSTNRD